jgi:small subunit ribosomal protein S6
MFFEGFPCSHGTNAMAVGAWFPTPGDRHSGPIDPFPRSWTRSSTGTFPRGENMAEAKSAQHLLREYETIFLVKPDLTDDSVDKVKERVRGIVSREGGKVLKFTVWGKKKTAYPVSKQPRAIYVHTHFLGDHKLVAEIERNLRNYDEVTRFITSKLAEEIDPDSRPVEEDVKLAGDIEEARPVPEQQREFRGGPPPEERVGTFTPDEEEPAEEA